MLGAGNQKDAGANQNKTVIILPVGLKIINMN